MAKLKLSKILKEKSKSRSRSNDHSNDHSYGKEMERLQLKMLRIQQGLWHQKQRVMIVFEGFDAAGKGGAIHHLIQTIDPRGYRVHAIGPPKPRDQKKHYLYRFWKKLPAPGKVALFDRSWYGRVLVERAESLTPKRRWSEAYEEINSFEKTLMDDGIHIIKIFLAIDKDEQLRRFESRLRDPYKQWKLTEADVKSRSLWKEYVHAVDDMLEKTSTHQAPWHLIPANDKHFARLEVLRAVTSRLVDYERWMESNAEKRHLKTLKKALAELGLKDAKL